MKKNFNKRPNFLDPHSPSPLANPRLISSRSSILNFRTMGHMQLEPKLSLLYSLLYSPYYILHKERTSFVILFELKMLYYKK